MFNDAPQSSSTINTPNFECNFQLNRTTNCSVIKFLDIYRDEGIHDERIIESNIKQVLIDRLAVQLNYIPYCDLWRYLFQCLQF